MMKALRFHNNMPRIAATKILGQLSSSVFTGPIAPMTLDEIPEPSLPAADWVRVRTRVAGICGSDLKQLLLKGSLDNPLTALLSFPHVLGHEAVGVVEEVGPGAGAVVAVGDRVLLNPWLSCKPRGIDPPCPACEVGDYTLCRNFDRGCLPPGIHLGNNAAAPGVFARSFVAHESQCLAVPAAVSDDAAVLGDPFSVSLHSILKRPPTADAPVLVYGLGPLGLLAVAGLAELYPATDIYAVGRHAHQGELARRFGAKEVIVDKPAAIVERVAELTGARVLKPWNGLPWLIDGVGVVYDTVGSPETLEVSVRVARARGSVVVSGVEAPRRFEWTPLYFKEIDIVGSNAFALEDFDGQRLHAMEIYLRLVERGLDVTPLITHRFTLERWRQAFQTLIHRRKSGAVKIVFDESAALDRGH